MKGKFHSKNIEKAFLHKKKERGVCNSWERRNELGMNSWEGGGVEIFKYGKRGFEGRL